MSSGKIWKSTIFSEALKAALKKYKLKQKDVATSIGFPTGRISEYATGKTEPTIENVNKIAGAFGLDIVDFLALGRPGKEGASPADAREPGISGLGRKPLAPTGAPPLPKSPFETGPDLKHPNGTDDSALAFYRALKTYIRRETTAHAKAKIKDELAVASGIDRQRLNKIYLGQKMADPETQEAIARAINIPLADFIWSGRETDARSFPSPAAAHTSPITEPAAFQPLALPIISFAACGFGGWERKIPMTISAAPPAFSAGSFVALAIGHSMIPAGIGPGMMCYCDPAVPPIAGDAVYVYNHQRNLSTIKAFVGWFTKGPEKWLKLRGWHDPDQFQRQKDFYLEVPSDQVTEIATVVCVRRRI